MRFSDAQRSAIEARGCNLLVSAAAGSGKTAVLAARILSLVQEGLAVDDLLVVTFTKAAAAEMRGRILTLLHDAADQGDPRMASQAMRVERADISTLHGFCAKVCRDHFQAAGVDPTFRVADGAEAGVLRARALEEALIACFEAPTPAFEHAAACLTQTALMDAVSALHTFLMARPDPWGWMDGAIRAHDATPDSLAHSAFMEIMLSRVLLDAQAALDAYGRLDAFARENGLYVDFVEKEAALCRAFAEAARGGYDTTVAFGEIAFAPKPRKQKDADEALEGQFVKLRSAAKDALSRAAALAASLSGERLALLSADLQENAVLLTGIAHAARAFHSRFAELKDEKNLVDFHDLEHFALRALQDPAVGGSYRNRYAAVFVDEYQDSSQLQEAILACVRREDNFFMVGDVKQSIYRFRLAEPGLFLQKLHSFSASPGSPDRKISLNANYRSHKMLLQGINDVFDRVFQGGPMELVYDEDARLTPGTAPDWPGAPIELHLITAEASETEDSPEDDADDAPTADELTEAAREAICQEADIIADRVIALRNAAEGGYRLRDMAILMRAVRGKATLVVETLRQRGIAALSDLGEDALVRPEVQAMVSLLRALDNMRQDVPLLSALRGPALGLSEESLAAIRIASPEGTFADAMFAYAQKDDALALALAGFIEKLRGWALDAQVLPLHTLLRRLYDETGHYAAVGALPDGGARQANLRMLAEHADAYQRSQAEGLGGFLRYLDRVKAREGIAAQDLGDRDDVVRVLSIHKSKGLQFPVVFVAGLGTRFARGGGQPLYLHDRLGAGMPHIDPVLRTIRPTFFQEAIMEKARQETMAEEARILYVAMTRAERRLILTGTPRRGDETNWQGGGASALFARSMLDWVAPCALTGESWSVFTHPKRPARAGVAEENALEAIIRRLSTGGKLFAGGKVSLALSWRPPDRSKAPIKQSVSSLVNVLRKPMEEEAVPTPSSLPKRPLFMEARGLTGAERGEAVHAFLRAVPLDAQDLRAACRSMVDKGILSPEQAQTLRFDKIARLFHSPLFVRMRAAGLLRREWVFNLRRDANGERTLLQGVIDCCFLEDGQWVVVDYKTDHGSDPLPILARYTPQISLYADALSELTGLPVKERILYLLEFEKEYPV